MSTCVARISSMRVLLVASNGRCCMWADRRTDSWYFGLAGLLACQKQLRLHLPAFDCTCRLLMYCFWVNVKKSKQEYWKNYYNNCAVWDRLKCGSASSYLLRNTDLWQN